MLRLLYESFVDVLAPSTCLVCEEFLAAANAREPYALANYICGRCFDRLPPAPRPNDILAEVVRIFPGDALAIQCFTARFQREEGLLDVIPNEDAPTPISPLLYALKYYGMQRLGRALGQELGELLLMLGQTQYDAILPVPIHSARERERGYNQSTRIAEGIADVLRLPVETAWIRRHTYTRSQTNFSAEERKMNVQSVFEVHKKVRSQKRLNGSCILLVDDILTTGATLNACAMTLLEMGTKRVDAATVAKA